MPDLGFRRRVVDRLELDASSFTVFQTADSQDAYLASMLRVGGAVKMLEHDVGALSGLFGVAAGISNTCVFPYPEPGCGRPIDPVLGADIGVSGSLRPAPPLDIYGGLRFASSLALHSEGGETAVLWLLPTVGARIEAHDLVHVYLEWSGAFYAVVTDDQTSESPRWGLGAGVEVILPGTRSGEAKSR